MGNPPPRVIRSFAALDLVVTAPFATPLTAPALLALFYRLDDQLGGPTASAPELPAIAWFFVHLAGILGVLWAVARLWMPDVRLARLDAVGRGVVAALLLVGIAGGALPRVLLVFAATELAGTIGQLVPRGAPEPEPAL